MGVCGVDIKLSLFALGFRVLVLVMTPPRSQLGHQPQKGILLWSATRASTGLYKVPVVRPPRG